MNLVNTYATDFENNDLTGWRTVGGIMKVVEAEGVKHLRISGNTDETVYLLPPLQPAANEEIEWRMMLVPVHGWGGGFQLGFTDTDETGYNLNMIGGLVSADWTRDKYGFINAWPASELPLDPHIIHLHVQAEDNFHFRSKRYRPSETEPAEWDSFGHVTGHAGGIAWISYGILVVDIVFVQIARGGAPLPAEPSTS